jgi:hypothetical protein
MSVLKKDFYFKVTVAGKSWYVCARSENKQNARKRIARAILPETVNKATFITLEDTTKEEYLKGPNFDGDDSPAQQVPVTDIF